MLISSFLLFRELKSGLQIIRNFSWRQRLHRLLAFEYDLHLVMIFHLMVYCTFESFSVHMYLLRVVLNLWFECLKVLLCPLYLVLNEFSDSPIYVSSLLLSDLVTVAWYIIPSVRHFPETGQSCGTLQLHSFWFSCVTLALFSLSLL